MKKLVTIQITFLLLISYNLFSQTGSLTGKVQSKNTPLAGATIQVKKTNLGVASSASGNYTLKNIPEGKQIIKVSIIGYQPIEKEIVIEAGKVKTENFELQDDVLNLNQVVITGTRNEIKQYNSPIIVTTVSNKTFENTQSLTMSEGLSFTPGLRLENNCQNCGFTQLRMNGLDGPYSQILINSRPIFSALAGVYGLDMLPASMIDRVEVVRGGGSALYGGNAIAGTVNIITKEPVQNAFEVGLNQAFTDFTAPDRTLTFNGSVVSDDLKKGISFYAYNRERAPWDANDDGFSEITKIENNTFGFDAFFNTSDRSKLKIGAYSIREFRRGGNKFDLAPHQSDLTEQLDHNINGLSFSFEQYTKNYKHKFSVYGSSQFVERNSYYGGGGRVLSETDSLNLDDVLAINAYGVSNDISLVGGLQYVYDINARFMLTAGSEYQYNNVTDNMAGYGRKIDQTVGTVGNYAQLQYNPNEKITLLIGGRLDIININGNYLLQAENFNNTQNLVVAVPRLSAMYNLSKNLKARFSFAQGYRAPQAFDEDLHIETVGGAARFIRLNPDLKTETSNSYSFSLNYGKSLENTQMNFVLEGFLTQLNNPFILSDQVELPNGVSVITKRNGEGASVQGINLEANFAIGRKVILQSGATLQQALYNEQEEIWTPEDDTDPTQATTTDRLLRTPNTYGYITLTYKPTSKIDLSYSAIYTGSMQVAHVTNPETEFTEIKSTESFFENNIRVAYQFKTKDAFKIQAFAGIQNFTNSYQTDFDRGITRDAGYIYGPSRPRTIFLGLKFGFN